MFHVFLFYSFLKDEQPLYNYRLSHLFDFPNVGVFLTEIVCIKHDLNPFVQLFWGTAQQQQNSIYPRMSFVNRKADSQILT